MPSSVSCALVHHRALVLKLLSEATEHLPLCTSILTVNPCAPHVSRVKSSGLAIVTIADVPSIWLPYGLPDHSSSVLTRSDPSSTILRTPEGAPAAESFPSLIMRLKARSPSSAMLALLLLRCPLPRVVRSSVGGGWAACVAALMSGCASKAETRALRAGRSLPATAATDHSLM